MDASGPEVDRLVRAALGDADVAGVLLFGSAARNEPDAADLDIAVVLKPSAAAHPFQKGLEYAQFSSGTRGKGLDVKVFQDLPLYIQHRVLLEHTVLAVADEDALYEAAFLALRAWGQFKPHYESYLEAIAHG